eukprot:1057570-Pelagomonas_calceolata.AAC.3
MAIQAHKFEHAPDIVDEGASMGKQRGSGVHTFFYCCADACIGGVHATEGHCADASGRQGLQECGGCCRGRGPEGKHGVDAKGQGLRGCGGCCRGRGLKGKQDVGAKGRELQGCRG